MKTLASSALSELRAQDWRGWRGHLAVLAALALAIVLIFARDSADLVTIWWTSSTFSHCLFIPFLVGWMVHQRRAGLVQLQPHVWHWGLLWLIIGNLLWLLGDASGVGIARHAALVIMAQGAVLAVLGPAVGRALIFPLFYAFFMIPFGAEIVAPLQLLTARLSMIMLGWVDIPAHLEGIFITIPDGYFEVAEACSGAKFVIAMLAYGVLVCHLCFRSWLRRVVFLTSAIALSILANGVRAFATIYVAHKTDVYSAVGFDHVVYGWLFFAIVMIVVMAGAWPFFDRRADEPVFDPRAVQGVATGGTLSSRYLGVMLCALVAGPIWSALSASETERLSPPVLPQVSGWSRSDTPMAYPWKPRFDGADYFVQGRYRNAKGQLVDIVIATYARQAEGRELVGFGQGAADPKSEWVWSSSAPAPRHGIGEQITAPGPVIRHVVTFYAVGGTLLSSPVAVKIQTLKARLLAGDQRAAAILVSAEHRDNASADAAIAAWLHDAGPVEDLADAALHIR